MAEEKPNLESINVHKNNLKKIFIECISKLFRTSNNLTE